jgi:hypothetical protein
VRILQSFKQFFCVIKCLSPYVHAPPLDVIAPMMADFRVAAIQELTAWFVPGPLCYASVPKTRVRSPHKRAPLPSIAES